MKNGHGSSKHQDASGPIIYVNSMLRPNDSVLLECFAPWEFNNQTIIILN